MVSLFKFALFVIIFGVAIAKNRATGPFRALTTRNLQDVAIFPSRMPDSPTGHKFASAVAKKLSLSKVTEEMALQVLKDNEAELYRMLYLKFSDRQAFRHIAGKKYAFTDSHLSLDYDDHILYQLYVEINKEARKKQFVRSDAF
ncbi:RxLR-like protein [Plasmopara halstedii]|uniref:RxLR-like protein n=1 Tax=Plasmopara halstedii TaxID=4781 RepID=A0A0P1AWH6_PLAHL|nr:RxLR-like protein [Plasmopara halstedii]CEG45826.1 RxLR-like protein [Plasmopara halstedii]|eukprot:XP_024582195.1 RxLR-like protein [Plasmopara halstedii]